MPLYILFIIFPLLELWAFVEVADEMGFFTALGLLFLAGIAGGAIVRYQGFQTVLALHDALERGKMPLDELFDGFCVVGAGILLIIPGFVSDALALVLLTPYLRRIIRNFIQKHPNWRSRTTSTTIIEGEFERVEEERKPLAPRNEP